MWCFGLGAFFFGCQDHEAFPFGFKSLLDLDKRPLTVKGKVS
ncbi:hypothetical protein TDIS_0374 [Thermosulfurimonas dismutans]|uniref:Uncharacterized protein n=1 Tax=Thermosulfurimonas dismutans TaxID=999894 RepID=A0A179D733_9BACT|nr:hypothetical protein TDIS_0374 [Thermosulfurimonas dismutans]